MCLVKSRLSCFGRLSQKLKLKRVNGAVRQARKRVNRHDATRSETIEPLLFCEDQSSDTPSTIEIPRLLIVPKNSIVSFSLLRDGPNRNAPPQISNVQANMPISYMHAMYAPQIT
ncbi:unnamed protein product [Cercospora beticola]|nr:unnamed protein product [Cercospora beticola]